MAIISSIRDPMSNLATLESFDNLTRKRPPMFFIVSPAPLPSTPNNPAHQPTERADPHNPAPPVLLRAPDAQLPRVQALFRRRRHLLRPIRVHHRRRLHLGHRQGHGPRGQRASRVYHSLPRDCVQAVQRGGGGWGGE
jgi:hypothetical protein